MRGLIAIGLLLTATGCHDWRALGLDYEGAGVCPVYVVAGDTHSCLRKTNGSLYCWGDNRYGQLGTGDTESRDAPERVALGAQSTSRIYAPNGEGELTSDVGVFGCAIFVDNLLYCWGDNRFGQLGVGSFDPHLAPSAVALPSASEKAALGAGHVCAQTIAGDLYCWGRNQSGQLGLGDTDPRPSPVQVPLPGLTVDKLAAGGRFTCVRAVEGPVLCWGANEWGQLGLGDTESRTQPTPIVVLEGQVSRIFAGANHACAIDQSGAVLCWGDNRFGQLGTGDTLPRSQPTLIDPSGLGIATQVLPGGRHTCAVKPDGTLWCWGDNRFGQLGTGSTDPSLLPTSLGQTVLGANVSIAYAGGAHTCAIKEDGAVYCWGNNQYHQLGVASPTTLAPERAVPPCE